MITHGDEQIQMTIDTFAVSFLSLFCSFFLRVCPAALIKRNTLLIGIKNLVRHKIHLTDISLSYMSGCNFIRIIKSNTTVNDGKCSAKGRVEEDIQNANRKFKDQDILIDLLG